MNSINGFNNFKSALLLDIHHDQQSGPVSYYKRDGQALSYNEKIKWILEKNIEKSRTYRELEKNIQSAVTEIKNLSNQSYSKTSEGTEVKNIALKIQEKVHFQIQSIQDESNPTVLDIEEPREFDFDRPLQFSSMEKIEPVASIESKRYEKIREAVKNTYLYSLVFAEYHKAKGESEAKNNWYKLLCYIHEKTFKDYSYEVHYLDVKTGKILRKDVVAHETKEYKFHMFDDRDNNTIIPLTVFKPKFSKGKTPVAIFSHGGPFSVIWPGHKNPQFCALAHLGYTIIAPNYRGSSLNNEYADLLEGNIDQYPLEDMQATINYIKNSEDLESLPVLTGISYGTYLNSTILDQISNQIKGVVLHTGLMGNSSPSPFDHIKGIRHDLPIFFAASAKDITPIEWSIKYFRVLQDVSDNLKVCILEKGGHHLIGVVNPDVPQFDLENIIDDLENNLVTITTHTSKRYNAEEFMNYVSHLVEFFEQLTLEEAGKTTEATDKSVSQGRNIVSKIKVDSEIKAKNAEPIQLKIDQSLLEAPFTLSLAHLAEIVKAGHSIESVVQKFLEHYDAVKMSIKEAHLNGFPGDKGKDFLDRLVNTKYAQDKELHSLICSILKKEVEKKGSYVMYHGANAAAGFIFDIYTKLQRLILIQAKNDPVNAIIRLRALDAAFVKISSAEELIKQMNLNELKDKETQYNYLPGYQDVGLSIQWFLFGSYKYWFNSTFFRYFLGGESATDVNVEKILRTFFLAIGITNEDQLNKMMREYSSIYNVYINKRDGRLMQIFASPDIIDEVAYVGERGGKPLELKMDGDSSLTHLPSKIISKAMYDPHAFEAALKNNRGNFKHQDVSSRGEFTDEKDGLLYMNSVEGRFHMMPEHMDNPERIQIVNYHSIAPKEGYEKALDNACEESMSVWIDVNPKLETGITYRKPPIVTLQNYIQGGTKEAKRREPFTLYDLFAAGKWEKVSEWIKNHPGDITSKIDQHGHTLLYQLLHDHMFEAAEKLLELSKPYVAKSKLINVKDSKGYPMIYDLLFEGNFEAAVFLMNHQANLKLTVNTSSMIIDLIFKNRFEAAKFLCGPNISEFTSDRELIKLILMGNLKIAQKRAQRLIGKEKPFEPKKIDKEVALSDWLENDLTQVELEQVHEFLKREFDIKKLTKIYLAALEQRNFTVAKELKDLGLILPKNVKESLITDVLVKNSWKSEDQELADFICRQGVSLNELRVEGKAIIISLIKTKQWNKIKWLQERGLDINKTNYNNLPTLNYILQYYNQTNKGELKEVVQELISLGINVNSYHNENTAIAEVCLLGFDEEIADMLLEKGANINLTIKTSESPFCKFLKNLFKDNENSIATARKMIKYGADVNEIVPKGIYLIEEFQNKPHIFRFLLNTESFNFSPSLSSETRKKILIHFIETEQWDKIEKFTWNQDKTIKLLGLPDQICQNILDISLLSKWSLEKTSQILSKVFEMGASPYEKNILTFIDKVINDDDRYELANLFVKRGAVLESDQRYSVDFIKWFSQKKLENKLNERQIESLKLVKKNNIFDYTEMAEFHFGRDFVIEILSDKVQSRKTRLEHCPKDLQEPILLSIIAKGEFESIKTDFIPSLNISKDLANEIRTGEIEIVKMKLEQLISNRRDANTQLWDALTKSTMWENSAMEALKLDPSRDAYKTFGTNKELTKSLLYELVFTDKLDRARWLIENGADINVLQHPFTDNKRNLPLLYCVFTANKFNDKEMERKNILNFLINNGADVDILMENTNGVKVPILYQLLNFTNTAKAKYLINMGANVNITFGTKDYPILLNLLLNTKPEYFESHCGLLIESGAKVNARTHNGHLLLTALLQEEQTEAAEFLISKGGEIDVQDLKLKTVGNSTVEEYLLANQLKPNFSKK